MEHYSADEEAYFLAMHMCCASTFQMVLKSAIELNLLELIKKVGPNALVSATELAAQLPTTNEEAHVMLDRILRLLSSYSVLNCTLKSLPDGGVERLYSLAPVCKYLTKNHDGVYLAPFVLFVQDKVSIENWYHLKDAVLEAGGVPFNKAHGMSAFEYTAKDQRFNNIVNQAMSNNSTIVMKKILETYNGFEGLETLVDVGGGIGTSINMIISKYPSIKGINFDLPHVVKHAPPYPGVKHVDGDMFVNVPKGDAIFMKWICHDWSDEHCVKLLKKCYEALPQNGKVILAECIIPEAPDNTLATKTSILLDVRMLAQTLGGKERTEKEFYALAKGAGFTRLNKVCRAFSYWIIEFYK